MGDILLGRVSKIICRIAPMKTPLVTSLSRDTTAGSFDITDICPGSYCWKHHQCCFRKLEMAFFFHLFFIFLLEYSCFTMLCQFLLYSKVHQLYVYIYSLFFGFPSRLSYCRTFLVLYSRLSLVIYFIHSISSVYMSIPISQFIPLPFPFVSIRLFSISVSLFLLCK